MEKWLKWTLLVVFSTVFFTTQAQFIKVDINSTIYSQKDSTPIGFVHIINLSTQHGVISEHNGKFNFRVGIKDTIIISVIGFEPKRYIGEEIPDSIYLSPRNYELETFIVLPYKNFESFKEAVIKLQLTDTVSFAEKNIEMLNSDLFLQRKLSGNMGVTLEGPITAIYNLFSKQAKSKKRYEELLAKDIYQSFLSSKYNNKLIEQSTPLTESNEIVLFMKFCDFSDNFIAQSSEYDLIVQIQSCYREYEESK